jgi:hypothetical protein
MKTVAAFTTLLLAATAVCAAAPAGDPLHTPECIKAQQALDAADAAASSASAVSPARSKSLRSDVARVCLHSSLDAPRPQRQLQSPLSVPPVALPSAIARPATPPSPNPPAVAQQPLRSVTSCDATGCWANDGTRLQRMGPTLVGPRGVCQQTGAVLNCP